MCKSFFLLSDLEKDNFNPRKELITKNLEKLRNNEILPPVLIGKMNDKFYFIIFLLICGHL